MPEHQTKFDSDEMSIHNHQRSIAWPHSKSGQHRRRSRQSERDFASTGTNEHEGIEPVPWPNLVAQPDVKIFGRLCNAITCCSA